MVHIFGSEKSFLRRLWEKLSPQEKAAVITGSVALIPIILSLIGVASKQAKITELQNELTPFRTVALMKYNKADAETLKLLANTMADLQKDYSNSLTTISNLSGEVEDLRTKAAPRSLTPEQKKKLIQNLSTIPTNSVAICSRIFDGESLDFQKDLGAAFEAAGWTVSYKGSHSHVFKGIAILSVNTNDDPLVISLEKAVSSVGFPIASETITNNRLFGPIEGHIMILLGRR